MLAILPKTEIFSALTEFNSGDGGIFKILLIICIILSTYG